MDAVRSVIEIKIEKAQIQKVRPVGKRELISNK